MLSSGTDGSFAGGVRTSATVGPIRSATCCSRRRSKPKTRAAVPIAALDGTPGQGPYATTKAGLIALALPLARELAGRGIRINTVTPGGFDTPMNAWIPPEYLDSVARQILSPQRLGHASEYAEMALALIENTYANATSIRLDGGYRMS
jgi:3-hydroxyacyl-CoA dehydrogenase / 3-hydroxy-2-methylbutyryl-CoA dehydrogenase